MTLLVPTSLGTFVAHYSAQGLARLDFPNRPTSDDDGKSTAADLAPAQIRRWHTLTSKALNEMLAGRAPKSLPPLDISAGTQFQRRVWQALREIGMGTTKSYAQVADAIGKPRATRAVGGACGANPIPVLIPCHRVLAANQRLGGFGGGLDWKRRLLACEGIELFA